MRQLLPQLNDVSGNPCPEYGEVFDLLAAHDSSIAVNYEKFFECIKLLLDVQKDPLGKIVDVKISPKLNDAIFRLPFVLGKGVAKLLLSRTVKPDYLAKLEDFIPAQGRLKVFSLNYDCCLEEACRSAGIDITTGYDHHTGTWKPDVFDTNTKGINLYKLHGSLRWFHVRDNRTRSTLPDVSERIMELTPGQGPSNSTVGWENPRLVLGPGSKMQADDPFFRLLAEFHRSLQQARVCVIIGYGHGDDHINTMLEQAQDAGIHLLDVNPPPYHYQGHLTPYTPLQLTAKAALTNGRLASEIGKLLGAVT
ncbi:MAG: SIR2 family protein [Nitrospirae bacterium]|nr:SIR2 family protein [Nitrospirota bacterium]